MNINYYYVWNRGCNSYCGRINWPRFIGFAERRLPALAFSRNSTSSTNIGIINIFFRASLRKKWQFFLKHSLQYYFMSLFFSSEHKNKTWLVDSNNSFLLFAIDTLWAFDWGNCLPCHLWARYGLVLGFHIVANR